MDPPRPIKAISILAFRKATCPVREEERAYSHNPLVDSLTLISSNLTAQSQSLCSSSAVIVILEPRTNTDYAFFLSVALGEFSARNTLDYLTRAVEDFDFNGLFPERPQVNYPI